MRALAIALALASCAEPPATADAPRPRQLGGTSWVMVQEENARGAPTLVFLQEDRANGFTGCNQWFAQIDRANNGLAFEAVGMTRRGCEPSAMDIERDFSNKLSLTRTVQVDEGTLTLIGENGESLARFERAR